MWLRFRSHICLFKRGRRHLLTAGRIARRNLKRFADATEAGSLYRRRNFDLRSSTYQRDFVELLDELTRQEKKRMWIEKTPNHALAISRIRTVAPSSRFIHLIRDGRAVVASLYQVTREHAAIWNGSLRLDECVREWNHAVEASSEAMETGNDGIVVHYDRLVTETAREVERLCVFLGLHYGPEMLATYASTLPSIVCLQEEAWKGGVSDPIVDVGLEKYQKIFSSAQRELIESSLIQLPENLRSIDAGRGDDE